jgi:putative membrane protein insertion efficiency factor
MKETPSAPPPTTWVGWLVRLPSLVLIGLVRVYQWTLSPWIGRDCRFQPTCSHYFIGAVNKYGAIRGSVKGVWRICRCHPWGGSGYDPP